MRRYHHLIEGVLQPEEIDNLQKIFDVIIAQPWFDLTEFSRETFASELIKIYRKGAVDVDRLRHLATLIAIAHFSRDMPEEKQKAIDLLHGLEPASGSDRKLDASKPEA